MASEQAAQQALSEAPKDCTGFIACGQNQSPLAKMSK
jgi:hypothetical protein